MGLDYGDMAGWLVVGKNLTYGGGSQSGDHLLTAMGFKLTSRFTQANQISLPFSAIVQ